MGQWILRVILPNGQCCGNVSVISNTVIMIVIRYWKNTFNFRITKQLVKDYGKNSNTVGKCCSNWETSGTFGRPFGWFSESFHGHCWKWHSYNPKISRSLQIFVLWGLAGMHLHLQKHARLWHLDLLLGELFSCCFFVI